jgi:hypothetical protein
MCTSCLKEYAFDYNQPCSDCGSDQLIAEPDIGGMTLLDLLEMLCDWKAAGERHSTGSMQNSLEHNRTRFHIESQLQRILENTAAVFGWK